MEYIQDFSFEYQEWQNDKVLGEGFFNVPAAKKKKLRDNFIKAIGVIGATVSGMYMLSQVVFGKSKKNTKVLSEKGSFDEDEIESYRIIKKTGMTIFGSYFALITMAIFTGSSEEKKKYQEVLDIVADEWNKRYLNKITGKQVARIITDNPKAKIDMEKIKLLNKMNPNDRNLIAQQQSLNLHQQEHYNAMMMHNQTLKQAKKMHNQNRMQARQMHNENMLMNALHLIK